MMFMSNCSRNDVILVRYPFSDLAVSKVRPAVVVSAHHVSEDIFIVPLTSRTVYFLQGEFALSDWSSAGLHVPTAVKRGIYTIHHRLIIKTIGVLARADAQHLDESLQSWLELCR
jgi:mRNA interferase MazF